MSFELAFFLLMLSLFAFTNILQHYMYEITEKSKFQDGIVLLYMAKNENYRCIYIEIKIMAEWHQSIYYIQCV